MLYYKKEGIRRRAILKLDRMLGVLTILLQHKRVTIPYLADKFEVSRRTISRDIDALCLAGIPVVTHQGANGGISLVEGFKLDKNVLSRDELSSIIAALKGIGTVSEQPRIDRLLDKFHIQTDAVISLHEPIVIDLASYDKGGLTEKIERIKAAILEQRLIAFNYYYGKGEGQRCIEPYFVIFQWGAWYVFGFCLERQDWRLFKLTRLWDLVLCDDGYTRRDVPPKARDFNAHFLDDIKLVALFDPSVKYQLIDTYGLECYSETDEGLQLEIGFTNRSHIISWLLGFGNKVKVLEPIDIAEELQIIAQKILSTYK